MNWVQLLVGLSLAGLYLLYWVLGLLGVLVVVCLIWVFFVNYNPDPGPYDY